MANIGVLWDHEVAWNDDEPFQIKNLDEDYAVYTELGWERNLELYIARFDWYHNGSLTKCWHWDGSNWEKIEEEIELDGVYDKYKFDSETRKLKRKIANSLPVLNDPEFEEICKDKLKTYNLFPDYVPETRIATEKNAEEMIEGYGMIVFKPRFGASGEGVEFIDDASEFEEPDEPENFVIQRFIEAGKVLNTSIEGPHDMRTHIINGELLTGNYIRRPTEGLQSNIATGGTQTYIDNSDIPEEAKKVIAEAIEEFSRFEPNLFTVDLMWDLEGRVWMIELNSKPGMYYHYPVKEKKHELPRIKKLLDTLAELVE